jgi:hypothetical protein
MTPSHDFDSLDFLLVLLGQALQERDPKRRAIIAEEIRQLPAPEWKEAA